MAKPRPLRRIVQDLGKLHSNRQFDAQAFGVIVRVPFASDSFACTPPKLPEGYRLVSAQDFDFEPIIHPMGDSMPVFAHHESRYEGQPYGLLIGPNLQEVTRLASAVSFANFSSTLESPPPTTYDGRNFEYGDCRDNLAEATKRLEGHFQFEPTLPEGYENQPVFVAYDDHNLTVECTSPWPHSLRRLVSEATGLPQRSILVRSGYSPSARPERLFDLILPVVLGSLAAMLTKQSVLVAWTAADIRRHGFGLAGGTVTVLTGHNEEGRVTSLRARIDLDLGAYPLASQEVMAQTILSVIGNYEIDNLDIRINLQTSSHPPRSAGPGFASIWAQIALEQHWDRVAQEFDTSPIEWRLQNLKHSLEGPGQLRFTDSLPQILTVLKRAATTSDYARRQATYRLHGRLRATEEGRSEESLILAKREGIGLAFACQAGNLVELEQGLAPRVRLSLEEDGQLNVQAPLDSGDQNLREVWLDCFQSELGVQERDIAFAPFDTEADDPGPLVSGRAQTVISPLLGQAVRQLKSQLGATERPLRSEAQAKALTRAQWDPQTFRGQPFASRSWGSAVVDLQIALDRYQIEVRRVWLHVWMGAAFDQPRVRSHLEQAIRERIRYCLGTVGFREGNLLTHWGAIGIAATELGVQVALHGESTIDGESSTLSDLFGVDDLVDTLVPAAFMNALTQALGRPVPSFPPSQLAVLQEF